MRALRRCAIAAICAFLLLLTSDATAAADAPSPRASVLEQGTIPRTPARLARGRYLVNGVLQCFLCHSDTDFTHRPARPLPGRMGGGHYFSNDELGLPPGNRVIASNISSDPEYGAGKWKDAVFVRALRQGIGHDGRTLFPLMPYEYFRNLSDEDLASVIVYIRSIPRFTSSSPKPCSFRR